MNASFVVARPQLSSVHTTLEDDPQHALDHFNGKLKPGIQVLFSLDQQKYKEPLRGCRCHGRRKEIISGYAHSGVRVTRQVNYEYVC